MSNKPDWIDMLEEARAKEQARAVRDIPFLFRGEMIRALLNTKVGTWPAEPIDPLLPFKWQTRRPLRAPQPLEVLPMKGPERGVWWVALVSNKPKIGRFIKCRYGKAGDAGYVRESFRFGKDYDGLRPSQAVGSVLIWYEADLPIKIHAPEWAGKLRPSIFLPRYYVRIEFKIMEVRCQRLQDISENDAKAEGTKRAIFDTDGGLCPLSRQRRVAFENLYSRIHGPKAWDKNPLVWAISFKRTK